MMDSRFDTLDVVKLTLTPSSDSGANNQRLSPTFILGASKNPLRVVLRNISFAAEIWYSFDAGTLQTNEPGSNTYFQPAGGVDTIMLAPGQKLYAISLSVNAKVSMAVSEALPADIKG